MIRQIVELYAPESLRDVLAALFEVEREIAASAGFKLDHTVSHARLDWWQDETARLVAGVPEHPRTLRLLQYADSHRVSSPDLRPLVALARSELSGTAIETAAEMQTFLARWADSIFRAVVLLQSPQPQSRSAVEAFAAQAGVPLREIELLSDALEAALHGRIRGVVTREEQAAEWQIQPWSGAVSREVAQRLTAARTELRRAAQRLPAQLRREQSASLVWLTLAVALAGRCEEDLPFALASRRRDGVVTAWRGWRAALQACSGQMPALLL